MTEKTRKKNSESLTSNMEDYLEAIYVLGQAEGIARVKDISAFMNVKKSSVNNAIKVLSKKDLVKHEKYSYVVLTPEGRKISSAIKKKHDLLVRFLNDILGIDEKSAVEDACKIEHVISPVTNDRLSKFIKFVDTCPSGERPDWLDSLDYYMKKGKRPKACSEKLKKR
jgi:DtxR family Mn-dependent transcriptional regulator